MNGKSTAFRRCRTKSESEPNPWMQIDADATPSAILGNVHQFAIFL